MLTNTEIDFILELLNQERVFLEDRELVNLLHEIDVLIGKLETMKNENQKNGLR
jgi:hypothetical protein